MNYKIIAKYIKNLQFEIPNPKIFFLLSENISNYKINIDIKSNQFKEKIIEVETSLSLNPVKNDFEKITTKIIHSTIIELDGDITDKKKLEEIILIKVPSEIYSEIRQSFIFLFEKSGFKKIKIDDSVDFKKLYTQNKLQ
ncbi:MAG: preprotein translocase subunit SecB [Pelagibacterales bacterium]|nr:preprotein translocase subunit SecB [Pelagibacterales bacterium]|tara:strand:- start:419 stop:838 length:420 start_codon:yes stop_codon:yes gene_type:complete